MVSVSLCLSILSPEGSRLSKGGFIPSTARLLGLHRLAIGPKRSVGDGMGCRCAEELAETHTVIEYTWSLENNLGRRWLGWRPWLVGGRPLLLGILF